MSARPRSKPASPTRAARRPDGPPAAEPRPWGEIFQPWHVALALALVHLALALLSIDPTPHEGGDSAAYLALAKSLLETGTYRELWDPAARAHTQYPPGWPLVLAGALAVGVKPWIGFKVMVTLFSAGAVGLSYLWARRVTTPGIALAAAAVLAVSPGTVDLARWELSDVPFWCFTMLALWAFARLQDAPPPPSGDAPAAPGWRADVGPLALAAVGTLLAYATRSAGLPLVVAAVAWLVWRRRWRGLALFAAIVGPFAVGWWIRGRMVGGEGYVGHLWYVDPYIPALGTVTPLGMLARVIRNVVEYTGDHVPYLLLGSRMTPAAWVAGTALVVMAAVGWGLRLRRRAGITEIWLPVYVALLLIWPAEWSGERFILPALPVLLVCAGEVVRWAGEKLRHPVLVGGAIATVLVGAGLPATGRELAAAGACRAVYGPENRYPCLPPNWQDFFALSAAMRGRLPENAVVLARKPTHFWAESGYPARTYPFTANPDSMLITAREAGARYVLLDYLDNVSVMYLAPVMMQRSQAFCVMEAMGPGRAVMMGIHPDAERIPNSRARPTETVTANVSFGRCGPEVWRSGGAPPQVINAPPAAPPPAN